MFHFLFKDFKSENRNSKDDNMMKLPLFDFGYLVTLNHTVTDSAKPLNCRK